MLDHAVRKQAPDGPYSEARGCQRVEAAASPGIGLPRSRDDALVIPVEGYQKAGFGLYRRPIDPGEGILLDEEGHLTCIVMAPEADAMVARIVAATFIGKIDRHAGRITPI